jgi:hypothetical protein
MDLAERPAGAFTRHPWEIARGEFLLREVMRSTGARPASVLDAGAGDGWLATRLALSMPGGSRITCWDAFYTGADLEELGSCAPEAVRFVMERPAGRHDVLLMLDVLEHVDDDLGFVSTLVAENLEPGGLALASVPAWPALSSRHDERLGHRRRYTPASGRALLERAGLTVVRSGGLFHSLLVPRTLARLRESMIPADRTPDLGSWSHGRIATGLVTSALHLDTLASRAAARLRMQLPGTSWWASCRK